METQSASQSGSSSELLQVGYAGLLAAHGFPLKRHKCWKFAATSVLDLAADDSRPCWRVLFACVDCKALQSIAFV